MRLLRTISTQRLLATVAGVVVAIAGGTAIALAAAGSGPVPRREPLAQAIHQALAAPGVPGITARISFTNHLIGSSEIQGADPILQGASGRLWLSPAVHRLRIELQSESGDAQVVVNGRAFWVYDPASNTAYEGTLPAQAGHRGGHPERVPTVSEIQSDLNRLMGHVEISGATPGDVAGRPTYTVTVSPRHKAGLLGEAKLAFDAARRVPLRFSIYARGDSSPVLELTATDISFGTVPASDFALSPPAGAKVVRVTVPGAVAAAHANARSRSRRAREVSGLAAVARRVPFALVAPKSLVGLPRRSVTLLDLSGHPAALLTYGQNLGGIAVLEQSAGTPQGLPSAGPVAGGRGGLSLPTVSIDGQSARELDTALGTVLTFTRGRVAYTVLGSVPPTAAEAAARAL